MVELTVLGQRLLDLGEGRGTPGSFLLEGRLIDVQLRLIYNILHFYSN